MQNTSLYWPATAGFHLYLTVGTVPENELKPLQKYYDPWGKDLTCYTLVYWTCYHSMDRVSGPYTMSLYSSRPSCAAPAATHETRKPCSPSVSTCSATNVSRCATTPDRGSAPSATVPSEPTTFTASTSPNLHRSRGDRSRENQRRGGNRETTDELKLYSQTFRGYHISVFPVFISLWKDLFYRIIASWWPNR